TPGVERFEYFRHLDRIAYGKQPLNRCLRSRNSTTPTSSPVAPGTRPGPYRLGLRQLGGIGLRPRFWSCAGVEPLLDYGVRDGAKGGVVVARMCAERAEGGVDGDPHPFREHALGLLDDDPAIERLLELGGGAAGSVQLESVARGHPGEPVGQADFFGCP